MASVRHRGRIIQYSTSRAFRCGSVVGLFYGVAVLVASTLYSQRVSPLVNVAVVVTIGVVIATVFTVYEFHIRTFLSLSIPFVKEIVTVLWEFVVSIVLARPSRTPAHVGRDAAHSPL